MADVHQNSSIHFLKKREMELEQKIENYKSQRIDLINLAEENKVPEIREKIVENKLLGIKNVPTFITKMDPDLAGNVQYMKDYLIKMKNEVKIKTKIRDELLESKFDQSRVDRLLVSNVEAERRLVKLESEVKLWRVANATKDYLDAINPNFINNNTDIQSYQKDDNTNLAPEEVIKMFLHNHQDRDLSKYKNQTIIIQWSASFRWSPSLYSMETILHHAESGSGASHFTFPERVKISTIEF